MTKIVLDDTNSGYNLSKINSNFQKIEDYINNDVLSRQNPTGDANEMHVDIDMNGHRVYNLPAPISLNEAVRLQDLINASVGGVTLVASLIASLPNAGLSSTNVQSALEELSTEAATETAARVVLGNTVTTLSTTVTNQGTAITALQAAIINASARVDSIAALRTVDKTKYHLIKTSGYYTQGDQGGADYYFDSTDTTTSDNGSTVIVGADGGRWKLLHNGTITVRQCGGKGIGTSFDDTFAFRAAVVSGLRVKIDTSPSWNVTDGITCATTGQIIEGNGKDKSIIQITPTFSAGALGLFILTSGEEGAQLRDFQVQYQQPDTTSRASLTTYPPTVYNVASPRAVMENCKVVRASYIYNMKGNAGACNFVGCEFSWFNIAIDIDGAVDSIKIDRCHFWPFGLTANQQTIFYDASTIGVNSGRADDLHIDNCLFINGTQLKLYTSGFGTTFGNVTNTDFDTNNGINIASGSLSLSGCYFSAAFAATRSIVQTGGVLSLTSGKFGIGTTLSGAQVLCLGGLMQLNSCYFDTGATDMSSIGVGGGTAILSNNFFSRTANITPTLATINVTSGRLSAIGNRCSDKGTGAGSFITITTDDLHAIVGNAPVGWAITLPASHPQTVSVGNTS